MNDFLRGFSGLYSFRKYGAKRPTVVKHGAKRDNTESSHSPVVDTAAIMEGSAVVTASQPRKKNRTSGIQTPLFKTPVSFKTISEFNGKKLFCKSYRMCQPTFQLLFDNLRDLVERRFVAAMEYRRATVPADILLAITLRVLARASYCDLSLAYQVKESTVFDIYTLTCDALNERLHFEGFL